MWLKKNTHDDRGYTINSQLIFVVVFLKVSVVCLFVFPQVHWRGDDSSKQTSSFRASGTIVNPDRTIRWDSWDAEGHYLGSALCLQREHFTPKSYLQYWKNSQNLIKHLFHRPKLKVFWRPVEPKELSAWALMLVSSGSHSFYRKPSSMRDSRRNSLLSAKWS